MPSDFGEIKKRKKKRREALGVDHKRLLYCVNVNRTSLDHLLLGESTDIDKLSNSASITREGEGAGLFPFTLRWLCPEVASGRAVNLGSLETVAPRVCFRQCVRCLGLDLGE